MAGLALSSQNWKWDGANNSCKPVSCRPPQFGAPMAVFKSFSEYFRFPYSLKGFGGTIRQVQGFGL